ncbi:MAG TPA: cobalt transporter CbiM, partial [Ktedonobacteraceae bacterium]|nr:cobalt transporter CbiM [Ktedonobacteraceae bacterium]
ATFSALAFTLMMFNIPVPGGTTAHAVGGTLIAIVLGPWAAAIGVSTALIIQALFFGDGGVLAIFINCLNMGILLPFVGYYAYRMIAGRSPMLSARRIWAAAIGSYLGMTVSALAVGLELGLQPLLFTSGGHPLYSPYTLNVAIPTMLLAHMLGASLVEALITGLVVAYLQKSHPEYLTSLRGVFAGPGVELGEASGVPLWRILAFTISGVGVLLFLLGLLASNGNVSHLFGADWSQVDWQAVGSMLLVTLVIAVILIPAAWFLLPKRWKKVGTLFATLAILAPLGLIAPGFAYGEGSLEDVQAAFGYVPQGLRNLSGFFSAPFSGYNLQFPFFGDASAPLWHAAVGYEISGIIGVLLIGLAMFGVGYLFHKRDRASASQESSEASADSSAVKAPGRASAIKQSLQPSTGSKERLSWLEKTIGGVAASIERAVFTEEHARKTGWLQKVDPRAKLGMFLVLVVAASLSQSLLLLASLYILCLLVAWISQLPFDFFIRRVWLGIPFFAGIVIIPSIFFVPGPRLFTLTLGTAQFGPTLPGLIGALVFVTRVGICVSLAVLLVLTTPWADLLKSLQAVRVPQIFILLLSMTYRYIFLFLHTANGMFEARKSRTIGRTNSQEHRTWISGSMGNLLNRSFKMSNDVYAAMAARGFTGEIRTYQAYRMQANDWIALFLAVVVAVALVVAGRYLTF